MHTPGKLVNNNPSLTTKSRSKISTSKLKAQVVKRKYKKFKEKELCGDSQHTHIKPSKELPIFQALP